MSEYPRSIYIMEMLDGLSFPATPIEIVDCAGDNGATEDILDRLQGMPDRVYNSIEDISRHLAEVEDLPDHGHLEGSSAL